MELKEVFELCQEFGYTPEIGISIVVGGTSTAPPDNGGGEEPPAPDVNIYKVDTSSKNNSLVKVRTSPGGDDNGFFVKHGWTISGPKAVAPKEGHVWIDTVISPAGEYIKAGWVELQYLVKQN